MYTAKILLKNGRIFDGVRYLSGDVALTESGIVAVGDVGDFQADVTFDVDGDLIVPGMTDIHTHLRGLSAKQYEIHADAVCFSNGVTSAAEASNSTASRAYDYTTLKVKLFVSVPIKNDAPDFSGADRLLQFHGDKAVGLKVAFDRRMIGDCGVEPLREICDYAHRCGLKVMVHCSDTPVPMDQMLHVMGPGDICTHIYHGDGFNAADDHFDCLREARARGIILDAGLAGGVHTDFALAVDAVSSGVLPDTVSTDITSSSAFKRGGKYGFTLAMTMMRQFGMPEKELLRASTYAAAQAVGLQDRCGLLAPGRAADVAVLRYTDAKLDMTDRKGHNLRADKGYVCMLTISDGYVVYRSDLF